MQSAGFAEFSPTTIWRRLVHGTRRVWEREDWNLWAGLDWEDRAMKMEATDDFHAKQGRSTCRVIFQADGRELGVYLKRHYRLPWWQGWLATIFPRDGWSPGWQEWRSLRWAQKQGLSVPKTMAVIEFIGPRGALQSFLAIEELTDMVRLHEAIPLASVRMDSMSFQFWKRGLILELARLTRLLHDRRRFHKDLYVSHFFIPRSAICPAVDWKGKVYLIDFGRLQFHLITWPIWLAKDLGQLLYSSQIAGVTPRDRLRFWRSYLHENGRAAWLRHLILFKDWTYQRHHIRKKRRAA
jgi:heptose I phosphotransferase